MSSVLEQVISAYPYKLKIRDPARVGALIDSIIEKGPDSFQVIADYDFTLTKSKLPDGSPGGSAMGVITSSPLMSEDFRAKSAEIYNKYQPMQGDPNLTHEEKIPYMVEWYTKQLAVIVAARIHKSDLKKMMAIGGATLRDGATKAMAKLNEFDVPLLIFSAGVGTVIESNLKRDNVEFPNQKVVANFFKFDDEDYIIGYENTTLIHTFNKNEHAVEHSTGYFEELKHRPNALLIGDTMEDLGMTEGMQNPGSVLKIGYLNIHIDKRLEPMMRGFDVVLVEDQTFDFVNLLLDFILKKSK